MMLDPFPLRREHAKSRSANGPDIDLGKAMHKPTRENSFYCYRSPDEMPQTIKLPGLALEIDFINRSEFEKFYGKYGGKQLYFFLENLGHWL